MIRTPLSSPTILPGTGRLPVVLSIPHSGTEYPDWLVREARRGKASLRLLEDPMVDRLAWRALSLGCAAVIAKAPRAAVDCNRSLLEMDPSTSGLPPQYDPGPRARGGLGIVPTRTPRDGDLWRRKPGLEDTERRISEGWHPYHSAIRDRISELQRRHGEVLLLDCHSMPPRGLRHASVVFGDRYGKSASSWIGELARNTMQEDGLSVAFNDPYAGGWIVEGHGRPADGVHAIQIELDRSLYLDATLRRPGARFDEVSRALSRLVQTLGEALLDRQSLPEAAE